MARHAPPLMRYATRYLRSADDADEVLQDTFLRARAAFRRGDRPERLEGWLFRIMVNRCRSARRRWWRFLGGEAGRIAIGDTPARPDDAGREWREEIDRALGYLSAPLREAFLLKHVEGFSYDEMAGMTGVGIPALKMRVSRACEQLRHHLEGAR
jgi:RNA polymerase sigma-70 factor, ECF subfamily